MSWQGIEGHDGIARNFARAFFRGRLEGSYLFTGPEGIGKRSFAFALAKTVLCQKNAANSGVSSEPDESTLLERFAPCNACESCRLFDVKIDAEGQPVASTIEIPNAPSPKRKKAKPKVATDDFSLPGHPDFHYVAKPEDKSLLPLELLIGAREERGQSGLVFDLFRTPFLGNRRVAVLDDADYLNQEGANALLKTLEEPPEGALLFLLGTSAARQLPTIRSRCRIVRFSPLSSEQVASILLREKMVETPEEGESRARSAEGSVKTAKLFSDASLEGFRTELYREWTRPNLDAVGFSTRVAEFVDSAGKEAILRRRRLQTILRWSAEFYRDLADLLAGESPGAPRFRTTGFALKKALETGNFTPKAAAAACDRTLEALEQVDRNANLTFLIESWLADLAKIA